MFTNKWRIPPQPKGVTAALGIKVIAALAMMTLIPILAACDLAGTSDLEGTSWELVSITGNSLLADTTITLEFSENEVSGTGGCNHYGASYQVSGNSLTIGDVFATEMACPEPPGVLEQEGEYLAALHVADSHQLTGERLEVFDESGGQLLVFVTSTDAAATQSEQPPENPDAAVSVVNQNQTPTPVTGLTPTPAIVEEPPSLTPEPPLSDEPSEGATEWTTLVSDAFPINLSYPADWQYMPDADYSQLSLPYVRGFSESNETLVNKDGCAIHIGFGGGNGPTQTLTNDLMTIDGREFTKRIWYEGETPLFIAFLPSDIIPGFELIFAWVSPSNVTGCIQSIDAIIASVAFTDTAGGG